MGEPMDEVAPADEESEEDACVEGADSERRRAAMHRRIRASRDQGETSGWALQTRQLPSLTRSNVHKT
jgi:hypothetical protein